VPGRHSNRGRKATQKESDARDKMSQPATDRYLTASSKLFGPSSDIGGRANNWPMMGGRPWPPGRAGGFCTGEPGVSRCGSKTGAGIVNAALAAGRRRRMRSRDALLASSLARTQHPAGGRPLSVRGRKTAWNAAAARRCQRSDRTARQQVPD